MTQTMNLDIPLHKIPRSASFNAQIRENADKVANCRSLGTLPDYPVFVDRLFKQMPMLHATQVAEMVQTCSNPENAEMDFGALASMLKRAATDPSGSAMHAAVGCSGEGGEMLDCVKKVFIYGKRWDQIDPKTNDTPLENLLEEMGDFRFYYQKLLNMIGITDEDVQAHNYVKLSTRYSSGVYTDAQAQERADKTTDRRFFGQERRK